MGGEAEEEETENIPKQNIGNQKLEKIHEWRLRTRVDQPRPRPGSAADFAPTVPNPNPPLPSTGARPRACNPTRRYGAGRGVAPRRRRSEKDRRSGAGPAPTAAPFLIAAASLLKVVGTPVGPSITVSDPNRKSMDELRSWQMRPVVAPPAHGTGASSTAACIFGYVEINSVGVQSTAMAESLAWGPSALPASTKGGDECRTAKAAAAGWES
nr:unnamed protein product [Digitaria exilis]